MTDTLRTYVAAAITPESSGRFEWRLGKTAAEEALHRFTASGDDNCLRCIEIPLDEINVYDRGNVTDWLDHRPELWEPLPGERWFTPDIPEGDYRRSLEIVASFTEGLLDRVESNTYAAGYCRGQLEFLSDYFGLKPGHTDTDSNIEQIKDEVKLVAERGGIL